MPRFLVFIALLCGLMLPGCSTTIFDADFNREPEGPLAFRNETVDGSSRYVHRPPLRPLDDYVECGEYDCGLLDPSDACANVKTTTYFPGSKVLRMVGCQLFFRSAPVDRRWKTRSIHWRGVFEMRTIYEDGFVWFNVGGITLGFDKPYPTDDRVYFSVNSVRIGTIDPNREHEVSIWLHDRSGRYTVYFRQDFRMYARRSGPILDAEDYDRISVEAFAGLFIGGGLAYLVDDVIMKEHHW